MAGEAGNGTGIRRSGASLDGRPGGVPGRRGERAGAVRAAGAEPYRPPATIGDPDILDEIAAVLKTVGYARNAPG